MHLREYPCRHQLQLVAGIKFGFGSSVDNIVTVAAGDSFLHIVGFAATAAGSCQAVMCQNRGFRVVVTNTWNSDGTWPPQSLHTR
jgi:hypothetical protein